jgi:CheY-like chemotaxis protein
MRVVVFDDVLFARQHEYREMDCELKFFEHADEAVRVVADEQPDVVLMDYAMEEHRTGEEAIAELRQLWPRGRLHIVGISADVLSNERLVAAGADDAVPKSHLRGYLRSILRAPPRSR